MKHALLPNAFQEASVVSLRHRYVLVVNSKTAGTTLKAVAALLEKEPFAVWKRGSTGDEPAQRSENWFLTPTLADLSDRTLAEIMLGRTFFRFTTVRHPFTRCWSAWVDKIVGRHPEFVENYAREDWFPPPSIGARDLVDFFEAFVHALFYRPGLLGADRHWAPQTRVLQLTLFPYDFVGKTESLGEIIHAWSEATGLPVQETFDKVGRRNARSLPMPVDRLSAYTTDLLSHVYAEDIAHLEYSSAPSGPALDQHDWLVVAEELLNEISDLQTHRDRSQHLHVPLWRGMRQTSARGARTLVARRTHLRNSSD